MWPALVPNDPERAVVQLLAVGPGAADRNRECAATGFLVNEEGYILTNAHVLEEARRCLAGSSSGKIMAKFWSEGVPTAASTPAATPARSHPRGLARPESQAAAISCDVIALDDLHDLALLKTERLPPGEAAQNFARLDPRGPQPGTPVATTGHPAFAWGAAAETGRLVRRAALALSDKTAEMSEVIIVDIPLKRGASGSPVYLQESGAVIGIVERQNPDRPNETVAVPIRYAIALLERHGVRWHAAD